MTFLRNLSKKTIAVIIAVMVVLSSIVSAMVIVSANTIDVWDGTIATAYAGGTGAESDPYLIETPEQLALMAIGTNYGAQGSNISGKYYKLTTDIYLNDTTKTNWKDNNPTPWVTDITPVTHFFTGNFDGNGHTIRGLYVTGSLCRIALFPAVYGNITIKNTVIADTYLQTNGGSPDGDKVAAFVGYSFGANDTSISFENCYVDESVYLEARIRVAGFVGGGGCKEIKFKNCASFATVNNTGTKRYGSFVGGLDESSDKKVNYDNCIGSIVYTNYVQYPTYTDSYCAQADSANSSNNGQAPIVVELESMIGKAAKTNMPNLNWSIWKTTSSYPELNMNEAAWDGTVATGFAGGTGTDEDPYLISTPEQLALMATGTDYGVGGVNISGKYYKLTNDIYVNDTTVDNWKDNNPTPWLTEDTDAKYFFTGVLDGNGHTISGLYAEGSFSNMGLFPGIYGDVVIRNVTITDSYFKSSGISNASQYVGAFVGHARGNKPNISFENCYVDESVYLEARIRVAGFIGYGADLESVSFKNCASFASVTNYGGTKRYGSFVGSLEGGNRKITYDGCVGNIFYTNYAQYPTYINSYCAVDGTADSSSNGVAPVVVALENMKGTAASINMPNLDWDVFKTTDSYPIVQGVALYDICKIKAHYNDDANTVETIKVIVGTTANIPSMARDGYYLEGWYTDTEFTTKFDPNNLVKGTINIYAKWNSLEGEVLCDFENYPFAAGSGYNSNAYAIVEGVGVNAGKALRYLTTTAHQNWWNPRLATISVGNDNYYLEKGVAYKVSFKYFVPAEPDQNLTVSVWAGNQTSITDYNSNAYPQLMSNELIITKETPVGTWLTYTGSFTAEIYDVLADKSTSNDALINNNILAIGIATAGKLSVGATVYIDDFVVEKFKEDYTTITVHTNGVSSTQIFKGVPGEKLANAPTRKDYIFEGWYSDAALTKPVNAATFPMSGNLDLYAKWKKFGIGDSITIGFDDYNYINSHKMFSGLTMNNTDSADGDGTSILATMGSSAAMSIMLSYKGYPVLMENGQKYLVSFSYKNLDEIANKWSVRVYATSPYFGGVGTTVQSSEDTLYRLTLSKASGYGTWRRHTYSVETNLTYTGYNAFALNLQTNSFSTVAYIHALIDSVTITKIADDDVVCLTNTLAGPDFVIGKKDQEIKLPTNMKVDGYKFIGWYLDNTYSIDIDGALFSEDMFVYAKWAKVQLKQDFENYNYVGYGVGYDIDIECYNNTIVGYNSKNVYSGLASVHRIGNYASDKKFTLMIDANDKISLGETYKITFYVKLASTKNADQYISILPTDSYFYPGSGDSDMAIPAVSLNELYPGVWYKITTVVPLYSPYLAIKTPGLSDIYFDNFTMELVDAGTTVSDDEKVVALGKVPAKPDEEIPEELPEESVPEEELPENNNGTDEQPPQDNNNTSNNEDGEGFPWLTVVICVAAGLGAIVILAIVLIAIIAKKRKA